MSVLTARPTTLRAAAKKPPTVRMYATRTVWLIGAAMSAPPLGALVWLLTHGVT